MDTGSDSSNQIGPAVEMLLAFVIYTLQVLWSRWWFTRFAYGPMEWLWRALTYGRGPTMRVEEPRVGGAVVPSAKR
jgi:uncharacterized protein